MSNKQAPDSYWSDIEEELGETVRIRCLAQYLEGTLDRARDTWCIFFVTEAAVYLQTVPTQGWQQRLKSIFGVGLDTESGVERLRFARAAITGVSADKPDTPWQRLVRSYPKERLVVEAGADRFVLALDAPVDDIAAAIRR